MIRSRFFPLDSYLHWLVAALKNSGLYLTTAKQMIFALALLFLFPTFPSAKTFKVQSGEHSGFSRIVILFGDVPEWDLGRVDGGYELRPDDETAEYNLAKIYRLIPRDRIAALEARDGGRLFLEVECGCYADAFEIRNGLVIDIKDNEDGVSARFEQPLAPKKMDLAAGRNDAPISNYTAAPLGDNFYETDPRTDLSQRFLGQRTNLAWTDDLAVSPTGTPIQDLPASEAEGIESNTPPHLAPDRVAEVQEALIAQLSRAAAQGLVSVDLSQTENTVDMTRPKNQTQPATATPDIAQMIEAATGPNVRVETAMDRGRNPKPARPIMTTDGEGCLPSEIFDIASWGVEPKNGTPFSLSRAAIFGEFDTADPQNLEALAKNYVYLTFGAETKALIAAFDIEIGEQRLLLALADIMDFGVVESPFLAKSQMACDTNVAMWAVLSNPRPLPGEKISRVAVLRAFAELPLHLRRHLGPLLAGQFLKIDDIDTATAIRDAIARAPGKHGDGFDMMEAKISLETGDELSGINQLDDIASADGTLAPEAIVQRIDSTLNAASQLPEGMITTAAALAYEARGTETGKELMRVYLRALAHSGEFLSALEKTNAAEIADNISPEIANTLRLEISSLSLKLASDTVFLQTALSENFELNQSDVAKELRRKIAARMMGLGLPAGARAILSKSEGIPQPEDRKLFASSFLQEKRPELAIGYLAGLTDDESERLRAESHLLAGEYDRAASVYSEIEDTSSVARAAWRGENWGMASETGTDAERAASELALAPEPNPESAAGPLAHNRDLLARSQETRQRLADLLNDTANP